MTLPDPTREALLPSDTTEARKDKVKIPQTGDEARDITERFEHGTRDFVEEKEVADNVAQE